MDFSNIKTVVLLNQLDVLKKQLSNLVYGSIEIRKKEDKNYLYIHYRDNGINCSKYLGLYTKELENLILVNSIKARELKSLIRKVQKQLNEMGYIPKPLTKNQMWCIDYAHKHLSQLIYNQAILEGVITTYVDTQSIIEGGRVNNMTASDINKIINLKHAWEFILNPEVVQSKTNLNLLCEINKDVITGFDYSAGMIRVVPVSIRGTTYKPPLPINTVVMEDIETIISSKKSAIDKAIQLLLYIMKKQIFIDGNKRTAVIFANQYLIKNGLGIIAIPDKKVKQFQKMLINYYENKDKKQIQSFLKTSCFTPIK